MPERCIDVDLYWITAQPMEEGTIELRLLNKGWRRVSTGPKRFCHEDGPDFDKALADAQQIVGPRLAEHRWEAGGTEALTPAAKREAYRIVGQWLITVLD